MELEVPAPPSRSLPIFSPGGFLGFLVIVAVVAGLGYLVYQRISPPTVAADRVTAKVSPATLTSSVNATGTVVSTATSRLAFKSAGRIAEVLVAVGDTVEEGQVVARLDASDLELAVAQAQATLRANEAKLGQVLAGPRREEVDTAQAQLEAAQVKLDAMLAGSRPEDIDATQAALDSALAKLAQLESGALREHVVAAQASLESAQAKAQELRAGATSPAVRAALSSLESARANLDEILAGPSSVDLVAAQAAVDAADFNVSAAHARGDPGAENTARANLLTAQAKLKQVQQGPTGAEIKAADAAVAQAEAKLADLQPTQADTAAAVATLAQAQKAIADLQPSEADMAAARAGVAQARNTLAQKLTPFTDQDLFLQEQQVRQAEANLALKRQPYQEADILAARANVVQAQANLATAAKNLSEATLVAPFGGMVGTVSMTVGETATTTGTNPSSVTIVAPGQVRVDVQVDEADIAQISVGQQARVTFDALPGRPFQGYVGAVAPTGTLTQGVVGYQVSIALDDPRLARPGMTAVAEIVREERENVLAVPSRAVTREGRDRFVEVMTASGLEKRKVQVGLSAEQLTEITAGLSDGEEVVVPQTRGAAPNVRTPGFGGGGGFVAPAGGGFGGGAPGRPLGR